MIIALDGPAAAGKGTIARALAEQFNLAYLDTGALYRATALAVLQSGACADDVHAADKLSKNLDLRLINHPNLRAEATGKMASHISQIPAVRANLLALQRDFADQPPAGKAGAILDGRDIGTVICPDADVKLFITASADVRAERRYREEQSAGKNPDLGHILADVKARDAADMSRAEAPLKPADDAHLLDTSKLTIEAAVAKAAALIRETLG